MLYQWRIQDFIKGEIVLRLFNYAYTNGEPYFPIFPWQNVTLVDYTTLPSKMIQSMNVDHVVLNTNARTSKYIMQYII